MPFFISKHLISQYEARIADLHKQICDLRQLAIPPASGDIPAVALEADAVLSGREESYDPTPSPMTEEEMHKLMEEISERDRVLSGTY